jgi:hypothetical protein
MAQSILVGRSPRLDPLHYAGADTALAGGRTDAGRWRASHRDARTAQVLALGAGASDAGLHPLLDERAVRVR